MRDAAQGSALALKEKGLRQEGSSVHHSLIVCSALALKEKGLRPIRLKSSRLDIAFSTGPERKGIETRC